MYQLVHGSDDVIKLDEGLNIPNDPENRHFQEYQKWLATGECPKPAEPPQKFPDYVNFWNEFVKSKSYKEFVLPASRKKIAANMSFTLFVSTISDAKSGKIDEEFLQETLNQLVIDCGIDDDAVKELQGILKENTLPFTIGGS